MKIIFLILNLLVLNLQLNAQKLKSEEVPIKVREAFSKAYPAIKVEEWEKENIFYEAEFEFNKKEMSLCFDQEGNIVETEIEIKQILAKIKKSNFGARPQRVDPRTKAIKPI